MAKKISQSVKCDYCSMPAKLVTGKTIYPHRADLYRKYFYQCAPYGAMVGCHDGTTKALGRLANAQLRKAKMAAHAAFDPIWKSGGKKRGSAYAWLADKLEIDPGDCHIGMFDIETCEKVVLICGKCSDDIGMTQ